MILKFKTIKVIELLRLFRKLRDIDKLRLSIHLLENKYLNLDIDINNDIIILKNQLTALNNSYSTTILNFNKYKNLTFLSSKFMELSEIEQSNFILDMLSILTKQFQKTFYKIVKSLMSKASGV